MYLEEPLTIRSWIVGSVTGGINKMYGLGVPHYWTHHQRHPELYWDLTVTLSDGQWPYTSNLQYDLIERREWSYYTSWVRNATYANPFPDHWEKKAMAIIILIRLRFPGVLKSVNQPTDDATSRSSWMAVLTSWNSYSTSGSLLIRRREGSSENLSAKAK